MESASSRVNAQEVVTVEFKKKRTNFICKFTFLSCI